MRLRRRRLLQGRRESRWSMVVSNTTMEDAPSSPPRDLTVVPVEGNPTVVNLNWQPPKQPNGQITGNLLISFHHLLFVIFI